MKYSKEEHRSVTYAMAAGTILLLALSDEGMPLESFGPWIGLPMGLLACAGAHMCIEEALYYRKGKRLAAEKEEKEETE